MAQLWQPGHELLFFDDQHRKAWTLPMHIMPHELAHDMTSCKRYEDISGIKGIGAFFVHHVVPGEQKNR